jgi:hypothetical protein
MEKGASERPKPLSVYGRLKRRNMPGSVDPAGLAWIRSSFGQEKGGPEIAFFQTPQGVDYTALRDSSCPDAATLIYTRDEWGALLAGANDGEFDNS